MPDCELVIQYISDFFVDFVLKIDSEQKSIHVNFHINAYWSHFPQKPFYGKWLQFVTSKLCIYMKIHMNPFIFGINF